MKALFNTDDGWSGLILRLTLGLVMLPHGAQKLLGWFGGFGFDGTMGFFTQKMGLPWIIAFLVIMGEFFRKPGVARRPVDAIHRRQLHCDHAGSHFDGASAGRVFHELVRATAGRGL